MRLDRDWAETWRAPKWIAEASACVKAVFLAILQADLRKCTLSAKAACNSLCRPRQRDIDDEQRADRRAAIMLTCRIPRTAMLLLCLLLGGCDVFSRGFLKPAGPIASATRSEFVLVCLVMLFVIGPVLLLTPLFAWHYRLANTKSAYRPQWGFNWSLEGLIWIPPTVIVIVLAVFLWRDTHALDPYKPLPGQPHRGPGGGARLEMAVHLPRRRAWPRSTGW